MTNIFHLRVPASGTIPALTVNNRIKAAGRTAIEQGLDTNVSAISLSLNGPFPDVRRHQLCYLVERFLYE